MTIVMDEDDNDEEDDGQDDDDEDEYAVMNTLIKDAQMRRFEGTH